MRTAKRGFSAVFVTVVLLLAPVMTEAASVRIKVIVDTANVRSNPNLGSEVVAQLPRGTVLDSDETVGDWMHVSFRTGGSGPLVNGYIHKSIVEKVIEPIETPAAKPAPKTEATVPPAPVAPPETPIQEVRSDLPARRGGLTLNLLGGAGVTLMDIVTTAGYPSLQDWGTFHSQFKLQGFYNLGSFDVGLEAGYNDLYWWYYRGPYGSQTIYRESYIGTWSILGMFQISGRSGIFAQGGAGVHIFFDSPAFGLMAASGYAFRLSDRISIPLFLRVDVIFGAGTPIAISAGSGIRIRVF